MPEEFSSLADRGKRVRIAAFSIVVAWIASVLILGFIGYWKLGCDDCTFWNRIYFSLQLLFLHAPEKPTNGPIQIARFLAPGGEIIGLVLGIAAAAIVWTDSFLRYSLKYRQHIVVCGLGRKGLQLVRDFRHQRKAVLVIERDKNNPFVELCDQLGAVLMIGDATKKETLHKAYLRETEFLIAACGDDGSNIDIAMRASQIASEQHRAAKLVCYVHIVDTELRELLRQQKLMAAKSGAEIRIFNVFENSARMLLRNYHLDHKRPITDENDPRQAHLVIFGFGRMGESVFLQATKLGHFPNGKKLRVTVIDQHAHAKRNRFQIRYPAFPALCDGDDRTSSSHEPDFIESVAESPAIFEQAKKWCEERDALVTCVVAFDNDSHSMSFALSLWNQLKPYHCPILVRVASGAGLSQLLDDVKNSVGESGIQGFGKIEDASSAGVVIDDQLNSFARRIHADFIDRRRRGGRDPKDPSMKSWDELDPDLKESNWQQAEHIPFKLRAIHCEGYWLDDFVPHRDEVSRKLNASDDRNVVKVAKMEHRRWFAERSLAGWKRGEKKDVVGRTHPDLKPWEELSDSVRQYDFDAVKLIPQLLEVWANSSYADTSHQNK
jgi:hypothetical protein